MLPELPSDIKRPSSRAESTSSSFAYQLPPLPRIAGDQDIELDVRTHSSLRNTGLQNGDYGDGERLRVLGEQIFSSIVTLYYFSQEPHLSHSGIVSKLRDAFCNQKVLEMSDHYNITMVMPPESRPVEGDVEELRYYWYRFIGALRIRNGADAVESWVCKVIDPPLIQSGPSNPSTSAPHVVNGPNEAYPGRSGGSPPTSTLSTPDSPSPSPPLPEPQDEDDPPPPFPASDQNISDNAPLSMAPQMQSVLGIPFPVAVLNQQAQKVYRCQPDYLAEHEGSAHAGQWTVLCLLGGIERGRGIGPNKKLAGDDAARRALINLGWTSS
ncbi:hypothetical protein BDN72DRAFT_95884 [Pluteus cervinus]|uniref:Uncharacterized protein n=1 Tax=Pluteus cervinus TaxID=181527 RepID=A0ACD3AP62_9AGAR|nr:hypothetical protein BDN72DRAFT_95884 [Pluteus cervinus]